MSLTPMTSLDPIDAALQGRGTGKRRGSGHQPRARAEKKPGRPAGAGKQKVEGLATPEDAEANARTQTVPEGTAAIVSLPIKNLRLHPEAKKIPRMRKEEWQGFLADVRANKVKEPIKVQQPNIILDGRSRFEAAKENGQETIPSMIVDLSKEEQVQCVYRTAIMRRHLTDDQRAVLAARYQKSLSREARRERASKAGRAGGRGRPKEADSLQDTSSRKLPGGKPKAKKGPSTRKQAAAEHHVPERKVRTAMQLERKDPKSADKVLAGELTLSQAKREQQATAQKQEAAVRSKEAPDVVEEPALDVGEQSDGIGTPETDGEGVDRQNGQELKQLTDIFVEVDSLLRRGVAMIENLTSSLRGEAKATLESPLLGLREKIDSMVNALSQGNESGGVQQPLNPQ
jgi:ParB-like chromosome segregation protein Spo0J